MRAALADVPPLPSRRDYDEVVQKLKAVQAALTPKVQDLREVAEWQQWANIGIQEQLCEKMEALRTADDPEAIARRIHELQEQWRQAADVPRAQGEVLWRRFKAVHDELWARCEAHFAAQASARVENLAKKTTLCERAEALADSTNWLQTAEAIKGLQAEWKTIGPVTRGQEKAIWERFRAACDRFFTRRQDDLAKRKAALGRQLRQEGSALRRRRGVGRFERLGADVRGDPPAPERMEDDRTGEEKPVRRDLAALSRRVRCVLRPLRAAARHRARRTRRGSRGASAPKSKRWRCRRTRSAAGGARCGARRNCRQRAADPPAGLAADRSRGAAQPRGSRNWPRAASIAIRRWCSIADSPTPLHRVISRWPEAFAGTDLDPDANRKQMEALVKRMEDLAASLEGRRRRKTPALSPTTKLAAMLKEALAANTIGGKVDVESRRRAAQEDVRQAQASWSRIGPVAEDAKRALAERFQRAVQTRNSVGRQVWPAGRGAHRRKGGRHVRLRRRVQSILISSTSNTSRPYGALRPWYARLSGIQKRVFSPSTISCRPSVQPLITPSSGNFAG